MCCYVVAVCHLWHYKWRICRFKIQQYLFYLHVRWQYRAFRFNVPLLKVLQWGQFCCALYNFKLQYPLKVLFPWTLIKLERLEWNINHFTQAPPRYFDTFKVNLRYVDSLMSVWWLSYDFEVWTVELKLDFALELTFIFTLK